MVSSKYLNM